MSKTKAPELRISEGVAGMWHYHYTVDPHSSVALCGAMTMYSGAPLNTWGFKPAHMPTSYCQKCEELKAVQDGPT